MKKLFGNFKNFVRPSFAWVPSIVSVIALLGPMYLISDKINETKYEAKLTEEKGKFNQGINESNQKLLLENAERIKLQQIIDNEHSQINFSVGQDKSFLDLNQLTISEEKASLIYKRFPNYDFVVPNMQGKSSWEWHEGTWSDSFVHLKNKKDTENLDSLMSVSNIAVRPEIVKLWHEMKNMSFAAKTSMEVISGNQSWVVTPNCIFSFVRWKDYEKILSTISYASLDANIKAARERLVLTNSSLQGKANEIAYRMLATFYAIQNNNVKNPNYIANNIRGIDLLFSNDMGITLAFGDATLVDKLVTLYKDIVTMNVLKAFRETLEKTRIIAKQNIPDPHLDPLALHVDPKQVYLQIFLQTLGNFQYFKQSNAQSEDNEPVFEELFFGPNYFVIKGYDPVLKASTHNRIRLHFLRIGIRSEKGVYLVGYTIPTDEDPKDVKNVQSMIHDFHILQ